MRSEFHGYYPPSDTELDELWEQATFVFDTNSLLNLFRYTNKTRTNFLAALEKLKERVWLPREVGKEFHRNRLTVLGEIDKAPSEVEKALESAQTSFENSLRRYRHHPTLPKNSLDKLADESFKALHAQVEEWKEAHKEKWRDSNQVPETLEAVTELFAGKVGEGFGDEAETDLKTEAKERYSNKVPPGYKDSNKTNGREYGDFLIWKEIIALSKEHQSPVIFVTDDSKEDWWWIESGKTQGPHPQLRHEFFNETGKSFYMYRPMRFLEFAADRFDLDTSEGTLKEVENISSQNRIQEDLEEKKRRLERQIARLNERENHLQGFFKTGGKITQLEDSLIDLESSYNTAKDAYDNARNVSENALRSLPFVVDEEKREALKQKAESMLEKAESDTELRRLESGLLKAQSDLDTRRSQVNRELQTVRHELEERSRQLVLTEATLDLFDG